jgi:hypothetical protein
MYTEPAVSQQVPMFHLDQKALFESLPLSDENKIRFLEMLKAAEAAEVKEVAEVKKPLKK